jgi:hypothetical protein
MVSQEKHPLRMFLTHMEMQDEIKSYRIVRRVGDQGARPPVVHQAGVGKLATGKERSSQPPHHSNVERTQEIDSRPTSEVSRINTKVSSSKKYCYWKVGTINVLTASDDLLLYECLRQATRANLDICCFQEFRRLGNDSITISVTPDDEKSKTTEWNVWWTGHKSKRRDGVGIAIRSNKCVTIDDIGHISARLMWIDCVCNGMKIRVIFCLCSN